MKKPCNDAAARFIALPPVIEKFYHEDTWPLNLSSQAQASLDSQAGKRIALAGEISALGRLLSDRDISESDFFAKEMRSLTISVYRRLQKFLSEACNFRLVLYLPFSLIPDVNWKANDLDLAEAAADFRRAYLDAWRQLLDESDWRANFVDGDVLEPGMITMPLSEVVKAAHLLPFLFDKGIVKPVEMIDLAESDDVSSVLRESLFDALLAAYQCDLLSEKEKARILRSHNSSLRNLSMIFELSRRDAGADVSSEEIESWSRERLLELISNAHRALAALRSSRSASSLSAPRLKWEELRDTEALIEQQAAEIARLIAGDWDAMDDLLSVALAGVQDFSALLCVESLRLAFSSLSAGDDESKRIKTFIIFHKAHFQALWSQGNISLRRSLERMFLHLFHLGLASRENCDFSPSLSQSFLGRISGLKLESLEPELGALRCSLDKMNSGKESARLFYPLVIAYGSKIKGYAALGADIDLAVFVRPSISLSERHKVDLAARELFGDRVLQFWLDDKEGLTIKDLNAPDKTLASSFSVHVLFNGVWLGQAEVIEEIIGSFLPLYTSERYPSPALSRRQIWLKELERDILQYRLLHKGYRHHRPDSSYKLELRSATSIDGFSTFFDNGYRWLATELFVTRVFLPCLP